MKTYNKNQNKLKGRELRQQNSKCMQISGFESK